MIGICYDCQIADLIQVELASGMTCHVIGKILVIRQLYIQAIEGLKAKSLKMCSKWIVSNEVQSYVTLFLGFTAVHPHWLYINT